MTTWLLALSFTAFVQAAATPAIDCDVLLAGGTIHDGSGAPAKVGDVAIVGGKIVAVGSFDAGKVGTRIDCKGLVVAPGFIDLHNHSDRSVLQTRHLSCANYLLQGCTTMVTGNCGGGRLDVEDFLAAVDRERTGCNIIHLVPHGALRASVLGEDDRAPTAEELERMKSALEDGLTAGAFGMSTGLFYVPGVYAKTDEIVELARVVARFDGLYASHMRYEDERILESIDEILAIGKRSGCRVHVSHFKGRGKRAWGKVRTAAERIAAAREDGVVITADQYPYTASSSSLTAYLFPAWARAGGRAKLLERMRDAGDAVRIKAAILDRLETYPKIHLSRYRARTDWVGKSLAAIADEEGRSLLGIVWEIQRGGGASVVNHAMSEEDVVYLMKLDWVATASDGAVMVRGPTMPHPRSFGTFPRKLGRYVREGAVTLEHAVRSATGLPAGVLGLRDRGYLRVGAVADVCVFDAGAVIDRATFAKPFEPPRGVRHVLVAGQLAVRDGEVVAERFGRAIRKR